MMLSFVNQKGGVGKTTAAVNLASSLARRNYRLVLVDLDPQGSAVKWHAVEGNQAFEILHQSSPLSAFDLEALSSAYDYVIVDSPPSINERLNGILASSDMVIIPVTPSSLDLWACTGILKRVKEIQENRPHLIAKLLINRKIPGTRAGREIRQALNDFTVGIMDTELCQRVAYIDAMKYGVSVMQYAPGSKAALEIEQLCDELIHEGDRVAEVEEKMNSIKDLYEEETNNIFFQSFQNR